MRDWRWAKVWVLVGAALLSLLPSISYSQQARRSVSITLDWVPSAEYYGFFLARERGLYERLGLDVELIYGSGAPSVAAQLAANSISYGTTTSDNLARQLARGQKFAAAAPLLPYNPNALAVSERVSFETLASLRAKTIGVNIQSVAYQQFLYLARTSNLPSGSFREYPIGFGGIEELLSGRVDAFLGYSTNQVLDARQRQPNTREITFDELGLHSFGLVLVSSESAAAKYGSAVFDQLVKATISGYEEGAKDIPGAIAALRKAEPNLDSDKLRLAISRIASLRGRPAANTTLDEWLLLVSVCPD